MVTDNHYRWDFIQLSTDEKPTPATSPKVADGSTLYTSDDSKLYIWYKDQWYEKEATGGGGGGGEPVKTLTSDDYDYPVASPQGIALWELDTGVYTIGGSTAIKLYYNSIQSTNADPDASFLVLHHGTKASVYWYEQTLNTPTYIQAQETYSVGSWSDILQKKSIVDNLLSTNASLTLSANQGYVLKGLIDALDARVSALEGN